MSSQESENLKLAAMFTIQLICESSFINSLDTIFKEFSQPINSIFQANLMSKSIKVKTVALKTLLIYLATI